MELPTDKGEKSIPELEARLFEKERIEQFLRAEVKELWLYIKSIERDPFLKVYLKIKFRILNFLSSRTKKSDSSNQHSSSDNGKNSAKFSEILDILLILPTDQIEIGGLVSANKFASELALAGFSVKKVSLYHDPSSKETNEISFINDFFELPNSKLVLACGAETVKFAQNYADKFNCKSVLLMQGPDPFFTPKFENSVEFINLLPKFNLVITFSPYLEKLARFWGSENVATAIFGPDEEIFKISDAVTRINQIVVPCRFAAEKGLKILLPTLLKLRQLGWKIIGFGDLPEVTMANFFDEFVGRIKPIEAARLFQESKLIIDPSLIEGLGLTTLEAAKCGCIPVIQKRGGFEGMFDPEKLPFIEIDNFLNPQVVIDAVYKSQTYLSPEIVNERVSGFNWTSGADIARIEIEQLLSD